ncbi:MAG: metallophosphoesterase [Anaerovoracaceae bacterium]|jgi:predicted phosphohydrolase
MSIYAIADLHLSFSADKSMDIFGGPWVNHAERLRENWQKMIGNDDTVIICGDISWGMKLDDAMEDLKWISRLPGKKIMVKGNHDLWWSAISKLRGVDDKMLFLQNDYFRADDFAICGSRGWIGPWDQGFTRDDEKVYRRELLRLRMSLDKALEAGEKRIIGVLHFPPFGDGCGKTDFTDIFEEYRVEQVVYGHLHGAESHERAVQGEVRGIRYHLVACDYLDCRPLLICD